ncbi:hypothetical protein GK047_09875 [Paenibacillus sp. SYP-B3998]|uniref:Oligohyaluronate lyase n=1 Tax=Paenibacillus sp. SYP-B3998 TaxID=2678564 RepID=A0A6G3ZW69_9BACL|nr:hypothetical protein [Paenibacillus sp. SYP-B3998]NEW06320.1 hypothetical protein [Paenibacillus sp. SYP-B3998]
MLDLHQRKQEIIGKIARKAFEQPLLRSGLLFEHDIRDNFYYASYLFVGSLDEQLTIFIDADSAKTKAESLLMKVLELQDQNPISSTYGHWPLHLRPTPQEAPINTLPVELMGSLMVYFYERYRHVFSEPLRVSFEIALLHIYRSDFYRKPLEHYHHHEAKYTATKLILGQFYQDQKLLEDGYQSLCLTLERITAMGMSEYGGLPWFWHWVQAFTCAWELTEHAEIKTALAQMLDYLWHVRSTYYLQGAWVGAHSRGWPHDIPQDKNVLFDYVQFGDFTLPEDMPRTEYAGFLSYEAPALARSTALNRAIPVEVKRLIPPPAALAEYGKDCLHSYVYITENYAIGGVWERALEFDNEQHRWDVTLPITAVEGVNRAFFFHPGKWYAEGDLRHQSEFSEVLFHPNVVVARYQIPAEQPDEIIGCLPQGEWIEEPQALYGRCGNVFMAVYVQQPYRREVLADRSVIKSSGRTNAIILACTDIVNAQTRGIIDLNQFADAMRQQQPIYAQSGEVGQALTYTTLQGEKIAFMIDEVGNITRFVNGKEIDFNDYTVS